MHSYVTKLTKLSGYYEVDRPKLTTFDSSTQTVTPFVPSTPRIDADSTPETFGELQHSGLVISNVIDVDLWPLTTTAGTDPAPMFPLMNSVVITPNFGDPFTSTSSVVTDTAQSFALPTKLGCSGLTVAQTFEPLFLLWLFGSDGKILPAESMEHSTVFFVVRLFLGSSFPWKGELAVQDKAECIVSCGAGMTRG